MHLALLARHPQAPQLQLPLGLAERHHQIARVAHKQPTEVDLGATHARRGERVPGEQLHEHLRRAQLAALAFPYEPLVPHRVERPFLLPGELLLSAHRKLHERARRRCTDTGRLLEARRKHNLNDHLTQVVSIC
eukprot:scaffold50373_cov70-Phaeocystis_antarctica.AAC.4